MLYKNLSCELETRIAASAEVGDSCAPSLSLPERIGAIAATHPQRIALEAACGAFTYAELDRRAAGLADSLHRHGAERGGSVAVALPRSFDQIASLLAVMKLGAAFMPLDPGWPIERLRKLLADAAPRVLVADAVLGAALQRQGMQILSPSPDGAALADFKPIAPADSDLAYIIYTSGSTGEPKGVEITHGNLNNLIDWHGEAFGITAADRASHLAGLGFDASVWEIWPYLARGASVTLVPESVRTSPALLSEWLLRERITIAFVPTALAEPMLAQSWPAETALRTLLIGAERVRSHPPADLPFAVVNNYGPTECTVVATSGTLAAEENGPPPIGRPIARCQIHLLDETGRPVAPGEIGEIHIGGASVGRGYHKRPDLTAERFLPDPFSPHPGARMYRTGDLGHFLPDGQIAFQGRIDGQVKIRGHRIEPDEISGHLDRHPAIAASTVVARGDERDQRLVAYIIPAGGESPTAEALRAYLAEHLPDYMIPAEFVRLTALPLTSSGKLDKALLPEPDAANALGRACRREPKTMLEQRLAAIVAQVLGSPPVGADDNFFLLGGHSLLGTQVVLRVRDLFGVQLTLLHLFEAPTVTKLALTVESLLRQKLDEMSEEEAASRLAV
jgi:amino acid adenylation domain-containing protein